jgi:hypothetical protein
MADGASAEGANGPACRKAGGAFRFPGGPAGGRGEYLAPSEERENMTEEEKATKHIWVPKVRQAIKDRAAWLLFVYRSFSKVLPADEVEARLREAIREYGHLRAKRDGNNLSPRDWVDTHESSGAIEVFASDLVRNGDGCEQQMTFCPLVEQWKEEGCSDAELRLLCDIAMEGDYGRAENNGLNLEIRKTIAQGADRCRLILTEAGD